MPRWYLTTVNPICYLLLVANKGEIRRIFRKTKSHTITARILGVSRQYVHQVVTGCYNHGRRGRKEKYQEKFGDECKICRRSPPEFLHHIDFDNSNDVVENLLPVCRECHSLLHQVHRGGKGWGGLYEKCLSCDREFSPSFPHFGKGHCKNCYAGLFGDKAIERKRKEYRPQFSLRANPCKGCGKSFEDVKYFANGRCRKCYEKHDYHTNPKRKKYQRRYQ